MFTSLNSSASRWHGRPGPRQGWKHPHRQTAPPGDQRGSLAAFQNAAGPKELHWIDGASHNDLYYKKQYVDPSVEKLTGFFTQNLGQAA